MWFEFNINNHLPIIKPAFNKHSTIKNEMTDEGKKAGIDMKEYEKLAAMMA